MTPLTDNPLKTRQKMTPLTNKLRRASCRAPCPTSENGPWSARAPKPSFYIGSTRGTVMESGAPHFSIFLTSGQRLLSIYENR